MGQKNRQVPEKGEGNHEADRDYRERTEAFIAGGGVEEAAQEAKRALMEDGEELEAAEDAGRARIAEEDPEVRRPGNSSRRS